MDLTHTVWLASYAAMLSAACWWDASERRIPNAVVFPGAAVALAIASTPEGVGLAGSLGGLATALALGIPLRALRYVGAGDAKLLAAAGAFVGFPQVVPLIAYTLLAGGALAIGWALARGRLRAVLGNVAEGVRAGAVALSARRIPRGDDFRVEPDRLPYAMAIATGAAAQLAFAGGLPWSTGL